ncbi:MAG: ankyrin repeat domain-containing protein [Oxalobacter formigenes]|nr:ankyrin repeat domain-containing protein [Oxalobacter formigenes]
MGWRWGVSLVWGLVWLIGLPGWAADNGSGKVCDVPLSGFGYVCACGSAEAVKEALASGADPNAVKEGMPPLYAAAAYNADPEVTRALLLAGAMVNRQAGPDRRTALHQALLTNPAAREVAAVLVAAGADVYALDRFRYTPIDFAVSGRYRNGAFDGNPREELILLLLKAAERAPFTMPAGDRRSFMTKKLRQYDINMGYGWRDSDVVEAFIRLGADERVMKDR